MASAHLHPLLLLRSSVPKRADCTLPARAAAADSMSSLRALQSPHTSAGLLPLPPVPSTSTPSQAPTSPLIRQARKAGSQKTGRRRIAVAASVATAAASATMIPGIGLQRPLLGETAPVKHKLPTATPSDLHQNGRRGWPFSAPPTSSPSEEMRRTIVKSAPRTTTAELSTAAQMARLSSLVYYPDPSDRLEALGLELRECQQTPYTAFFVADGPSDLSGLSSSKTSKNGQEGGKTRYIIARGVAFDRAEVRIGDLWSKLLRFWPTEFERGLTPRGADLLVHEGVKEIADQVYQSLLPYLAIDAKRDGITSVRFGGHSLGGSLSLLLMLMFHLRSPVRKGYSSDIEFSAHTFGSFPVVASPFHLPWGEPTDDPTEQQQHSCALLRTLSSLRSQLKGYEAPNALGQTGCSVMDILGLPAGTAQGFVLDSDIIPRAFLALKHDAVRGLLGVREKVLGPQGSFSFASIADTNPGIFRPLGRVNLMHTQGSEVSVASLQPYLAEKALHIDLDEFVRNPSLLVKSIQDHYFNHYVTGLDSALAASRLEGLL